MTRKEAVEHLNTIGQYYSQDRSDPYEEYEILTKDELDAIYLAIEALEQESCDDSISRQAVLEVIEREQFKGDAISEIEKLQTVQPKYNTSEWCHDCKEYDHDKHCCPRYNKVIRKTVEEIKELKMGHWISYWDEEARCHVYKCPECGNKQPFDTKHCWECGSRLVEPQESEES